MNIIEMLSGVVRKMCAYVLKYYVRNLESPGQKLTDPHLPSSASSNSIAIISKKWHFSSSHIYDWFTEAIFINIKDQDELLKTLKFLHDYLWYNSWESMYNNVEIPFFAFYYPFLPVYLGLLWQNDDTYGYETFRFLNNSSRSLVFVKMASVSQP